MMASHVQIVKSHGGQVCERLVVVVAVVVVAPWS
jgi:hypothetical protein